MWLHNRTRMTWCYLRCKFSPFPKKVLAIDCLQDCDKGFRALLRIHGMCCWYVFIGSSVITIKTKICEKCILSPLRGVYLGCLPDTYCRERLHSEVYAFRWRVGAVWVESIWGETHLMERNFWLLQSVQMFSKCPDALQRKL